MSQSSRRHIPRHSKKIEELARFAPPEVVIAAICKQVDAAPDLPLEYLERLRDFVDDTLVARSPQGAE